MTWPRSPYWPALYTMVAFNADPNDPAATPAWVDLSDRMIDFGPTRGKQYELDQVQAGTGTMTLVDPGEDLNPANAASPYYPNVRPYRQIIVQAQWPPTPVGGAVNLLNAASEIPANPRVFYDPSFESYTAGAALPWIINDGGVAATVSTAQHFAGTKSLGWSVTVGGEQGVYFNVRTVPGQQYTASAYVYQTAANNTTLQQLGGAVGTGTSAVNTWVRLSVTFTATQPSHRLWAGSVTTGAAGQVWADQIQLEPGATASTWASTGPTIYPVFTGWVERWPRTWNYQGTYGVCAIQVVDALGVLAQQAIGTTVYNEILLRQPLYYWPLQDDQNAASFGDASGNGGVSLSKRVEPTGPGTFTPGGSGGILGDPSGVAVGMGFATGSTILGAGKDFNGTPGLQPRVPANPASSWGLTVAFWLMLNTVSSGGDRMPLILFNGQSATAEVPVAIIVNESDQPGKPYATIAYGTAAPVATSSQAMTAGTWYHLAATVTQNPTGNTVITVYLDGNQVAQTTATTASLGGPLTSSASSIGVGGQPFTGGTNASVIDGSIAHVAVWNTALSGDDIYRMSFAGTVAWDAETSGQRIARYLGYRSSGIPSNLETGSSPLGPDPATGPAGGNLTYALDAVNGVVLSENGQFFAARDGVVRFLARSHRYLEMVPSWVLGEQESPYQGDIAYDYDPTQVFNDVTITRTGGAVVHISDATSIKQYWWRSLQREIQIKYDAEATDAANYLLNRYRQPVQRISVLTLNPAANPSLWPVVLGMEISDRITVKRRTKTVTMSSDFFIEQLAPSIAFKDGAFALSLQASPVDRQQAWILGDPTFGVLGSTTRLGY